MLPQEDFVVRTIVRPQSGACAFESVTRQDPTPFVDRKTEQELFRAQDKSFRPTFTSKPWIRTVTATEAVSLQVHSRLYPGPFLYSITAGFARELLSHCGWEASCPPSCFPPDIG